MPVYVSIVTALMGELLDIQVVVTLRNLRTKFVEIAVTFVDECNANITLQSVLYNKL